MLDTPHAAPGAARTHAASRALARMSRGRWFALAAAGVALATCAYLFSTEPRYTGLHAASVTMALAALAAALARRLLLAALGVAAMVGVVAAVAEIKRARTDFVLHAYELFEPLRWSFSPLEIVRDHPELSAVFAVSLLLLLAGPLALRRLEPRNARRLPALLALAAFAALGGWASHMKREPRQTQYTWEDVHLSSFYSSWPETLQALSRGLFEVGPPAGALAFDPRPACAPSSKPPHVILIHQESVTPPTGFPGLAYDPSVLPFFASHDGRRHALRVETYGGASWLTEFSVLTGMSSRFFGGLRNFVQVYMAGRTDDALPAAMARCGYRNVMFYPYVKGFMGSGRFFESVGFPEIFDMKAQGAPTNMEPDSVYFANAMDEIARHVAGSSAPLFAFVQTMSAHWPYDVTMWPERAVPGGPGAHPEMSEYLRRLAMGNIDQAWLRAELARRFPQERFLVVQYGDHQPLASRIYFGFSTQEAEEILSALPAASPAYLTFYSANGVNYAPPPLPRHETVDAPYLGAILLQQAGLPLPDSWRERLRLMDACEGAYAACTDRALVLAFHRRLVDSGLVRAR
ncbi:MAG: sulfatase [Hyphomicrobiales bacterium]|nr:sulfatase [Hyphomicrobiales bacterium]